MKKPLMKTLSLLLILIVTLQLFPLNSVVKASSDNNYYVINGGTGDGRTQSTPAGSVADAIKAINADGLGKNDTANIYIMQRENYTVTPSDNKHYITYWSENGDKPDAHTARIVVRPFDVSIKTDLAPSATLGGINQFLQLSGPTTFKGVRILAMRGYWSREIYANGNDFTVEKDVTFGDLASGNAVATNCYGMKFSISNKNGGSTYNTPININYNAPTIADAVFHLNNYAGGTTTFNEDVNITIDNPNLGSHATISYPINFNGTTVFNKNLNLHIKAADKIAFNNTDGSSITANGGIQLISGPSVNYTAKLDSLTCFSADTKIWDITLSPSAEDVLEFTSVAGTYSLTKDITVVAENEEGVIVTSDKNGKLTLEPGSWTVSKKRVIHYGDINSDGEIDVRDLVGIKKRISKSEYFFQPADINCDYFINSADIVLIKKHLLDSKIIEWENYKMTLPVPQNLSGGADKEAQELKNSITNAPDTIEASGTTYYIAESGNDSNNGTSPETPITVSKINSLPLAYGDAVLFKRGDTFRMSTHISHKSGVSYGAYGSGEKPVLSGSLANYANEKHWFSEDGNIWKCYLSGEAGHIVFDEGKTIGFRKTSLDLVENDGDYYHDMENGILYLYLSQRNPGNYFDSIEISTTEYLIFGGNSENLRSDITFENLSFKYASIHAMYLIGSKNFDIHGCEYYWIGGAYYDNEGKRLGNAIQFWSVAENCNASDNYFYEIFDAPITYQGLSVNRYIDMVFENNLIEYCSMNFEIWGQNPNTKTDTSSDPEAILKNTYFNNNILRFSGYGFGGIQRPDKSEQAFILTWYHKYNDGQTENINICNNIFDTANSNFFYTVYTVHQMNISNNTYYQQPGSEHKVVSHCDFYSDDQYSFEKAIALVDKNPKSVVWLG